MARQAAIATLGAVCLYFFKFEGICFNALIRERTAGLGLNSNLESIRLLAASGRSLFYNVFVDPLRELGRTLLFLGGLLFIIGALLFIGGKLPFRLGRLPGDIIHRGEHTTFYFPIVTCLVLSLAVSFLFWLFSHFRR